MTPLHPRGMVGASGRSGHACSERERASTMPDTQSTEKRKHPRAVLSCPISLFTQAGELVVQGKTHDISDGGALLPAPVEKLPRIDQMTNVAFSVPRSTTCTYMLEDFSCEAKVVRHQPMLDDSMAGVALQFEVPQDLGLDV